MTGLGPMPKEFACPELPGPGLSRSAPARLFMGNQRVRNLMDRTTSPIHPGRTIGTVQKILRPTIGRTG